MDKKQCTAAYMYQLRISLSDITPQIWRSFEVPGSATLEDLHYLIMSVMGWDGTHLHCFVINGKRYAPESEDSMFDNGEKNEADYTLDKLELKKKQKIKYTYDFGDDWLHEITVSKILPIEECPPEARTARCLDGERACPLEDCGGVFGYYSILEALASPRKKENRERLEWFGGKYDPEAFDIDAVNKHLGNL